MSVFSSVSILLICVLVAIPFVREARKRRLSDADREGAPGEFVALSQGVTHYRWVGPARGPVLVAIHGLTTPLGAWVPLAERLGNMGYRVLTYDLWGRGLSDLPPGKQDEAYFLRQLEELLIDQGLTENVSLLGYSMGGAIATAFAAKHSHVMRGLMLVAPSGIETRESMHHRYCRTVPGIGDWLFLLVEGRRLRQIAREHTPKTARERYAGVRKQQLDQIDRKGFLGAVLSSRRHLLEHRQADEHRAIAKAGIPVFAVWAEDDPVIPVRALSRLTAWNPEAFHEVVPEAGHAVPFTHPEEVALLLRSMLLDHAVRLRGVQKKARPGGRAVRESNPRGIQ